MELTRQQLEHEIKFKEDDLREFRKGLELMRTRLQLSEITPTLLLPLHEWSGARGLVELGEVISNNMERVLDELRHAAATNRLERAPFLHIVPLKSVNESLEDDDEPPEPPTPLRSA